MIYHHFPYLGSQEYKQLPSLPDSLPPVNGIHRVIPDSLVVESLSVQMFRGKPVFRVETSARDFLLAADSSLRVVEEGVPFHEVSEYARQWCAADIRSVDTLRCLDQWIPYSNLKSDFPIYRFSFADEQETILYISSVTGRALQCVTREQRVWAWLGPIPHMLYFWQLRQHRAQWVSLVSWLAGIGALMCLAGMVIGVRSYVLAYRRRKRFISPYKKFFFKWHHVLGFVFGFFVFMFALSGLMSVNDLPQWMVRTHNTAMASRLRESPSIDLSAFTADYRRVVQQHKGEVKEISFNQYGAKPYYSVVLNGAVQNFDASQPEPKPLYLSQQDVLNRLSTVCDAPKTISLMTEFDSYYVGFTKRMELPVYKVIASNPDQSVFYVNPNTGRTRYFNRNLRAGKWIYPAFHSLRFKFFAEHRVLRDVVLWILLIGGTLVSFTGVVLGLKYIVRLATRRR